MIFVHTRIRYSTYMIKLDSRGEDTARSVCVCLLRLVIPGGIMPP